VTFKLSDQKIAIIKSGLKIMMRHLKRSHLGVTIARARDYSWNSSILQSILYRFYTYNLLIKRCRDYCGALRYSGMKLPQPAGTELLYLCVAIFANSLFLVCFEMAQ
jgi:hypothetical protein